MRFFNRAGPVNPEIHYLVPPLARLGRAEILRLIEWQDYFVLRAPRQSGKTTTPLALRDELNRRGYRAVNASLETAQPAGEDTAATMRTVLDRLAAAALRTLDDRVPGELWPGVLERSGPFSAFETVLSKWSEASGDGRLVLLLDEVDALSGTPLLSLLRQLFVIECKVRRERDGLEALVERGVAQTAAYMDTAGAEEGHLVIFDQDLDRPWADRAFTRELRARPEPHRLGTRPRRRPRTPRRHDDPRLGHVAPGAPPSPARPPRLAARRHDARSRRRLPDAPPREPPPRAPSPLRRPRRAAHPLRLTR